MDSSLRIALVQGRHADARTDPERAGGAERYLNQLAASLARDGHHVTVLCRRHGAAPAPGVEFVRLSASRPVSAWRSWAFARAVERHLRDGPRRYDLVVGLGRTYAHDVWRCGGGLRGTYEKIQREFADEAAPGLPARIDPGARVARALERRAVRDAARGVLTNSTMVQRDIVRTYGLSEDAVTVIPNGVDPARFDRAAHADAAVALRGELGLADAFVVLFVGIGFARKGLEHALRALPAVRRERPEVRLVVLGTDGRRARYEALAAELGQADAVRFVGARSDPEAFFAAADLHVLPTHYDTFAYTVLEAFASGVPVVTTRRAGAAEWIEDGVHGRVLEHPGDVEALTRALLDWCDPERCAAAAGGVREVALELSVERCMGRTRDWLLERVQAHGSTFS